MSDPNSDDARSSALSADFSDVDGDDDDTSLAIAVDEADAGMRLDKFVTALDETPTRSQIKNAIDRGEITVDGETVKAGFSLRAGDVVEVALRPPPTPADLVPEDLPLEILHEDADLIVLCKASGMVVHPAPGHPRGTLANAVLHHCGPELKRVGAAGRPGIVHRLDKDTSGVMVVAKTLHAHAALGEQFKAHSIERAYLALCLGAGLPSEGTTFDTLHGRHPRDRKRFSSRVERGRRAITHVEVLERYRDGATLVRCRLETGRTHQIRVHLSDHNAPILGDPKYGGRAASRAKIISRTALHAHRLGFEHPRTGERVTFDHAPPDDMASAIEHLRGGGAWR